MSTIRIVRKEETDQATMGQVYVDGEELGYTLEQPWNNNQEGSCIPPGEYIAYIRDKATSRWDYNPIQLVNVYNRSYIQIHIGNKPEHTEGCILVGKGRGKNAVWSSQDAYNELMKKLDKTKEIKVIIEYEN